MCWRCCFHKSTALTVRGVQELSRRPCRNYTSVKDLFLEPYSETMPRVIKWSQGGGAISHERGTPVEWDLYVTYYGHNAIPSLTKAVGISQNDERGLA